MVSAKASGLYQNKMFPNVLFSHLDTLANLDENKTNVKIYSKLRFKICVSLIKSLKPKPKSGNWVFNLSLKLCFWLLEIEFIGIKSWKLSVNLAPWWVTRTAPLVQVYILLNRTSVYSQPFSWKSRVKWWHANVRYKYIKSYLPWSVLLDDSSGCFSLFSIVFTSVSSSSRPCL